jgi:hypothetical protein
MIQLNNRKLREASSQSPRDTYLLIAFKLIAKDVSTASV